MIHQDTLLELQIQEMGERRERLSRTNSRKEASTSSSADKQATDLSLLQKQHILLQEELGRCRQLCQEKVQEATALEAQLQESEQERARLEREVDEARRQLAAQRHNRATMETSWVRKGAEPRRRSLPAGDALYQTFTAPQVNVGSKLKAPLLLETGEGWDLRAQRVNNARGQQPPSNVLHFSSPEARSLGCYEAKDCAHTMGRLANASTRSCFPRDDHML